MANEYDKIIKENIEAVFLPVMDKLLGIRSDGSFEELPDDLQVTIERRPDFVKRVALEDAPPYILHLEFQSTDDTSMVYRMLEYRALLTRKYRMPVLQFVIYIGSKPPNMSVSLQQENLDYRFILKDIQDYDHENLLASDIPEEIILAVLGNFKGQPPPDIIRSILQKLIHLTSDKTKLQRYIRQLGVLSKLRNLQKETFQKIKTMAVEYDIETDYLFQQGKLEGVKEGIKEGIREGRDEEKEKFVVNMLRSGQLTNQQIATFAEVSMAYVEKVRDTIDL